MSAEYKNQDPLDIAAKAEQDLNTLAAKGNTSTGMSDSTLESGIDASATSKFPGASVDTSARDEIPTSEGGSIKPSGKPTKARDFEGVGGPEDKARLYAENHGGDDDVRDNIRQGGETIRPAGQVSNEAREGEGHGTV